VDVRLAADDDIVADADRTVIVTGPSLRARVGEPAPTALLRLRTVELPHPILAIGPLAGGRRLLSDDRRWLESLATMAAQRIDSLRVAHERFERDRREQRIEQLATEAELRALRAQLNPHFLFNALTTVGYLIQSAPTRAVQTLLQLTTVLRGVLRRSTTEFSTLAEELDLIRSYLDIERARFEERLDVQIDVADDALEVALPTLLVQPLVENAVKHGLSPMGAGGTLRIHARIADGRLVLTVADTGAGFDPAVLAQARGVGLASVAQRLAVHYGSAAHLDIRSRAGGGTAVEIDMPAHAASPQPKARRRAG
jgi:two-component system LytT family sensor kinase